MIVRYDSIVRNERIKAIDTSIQFNVITFGGVNVIKYLCEDKLVK